MKKYRGELYILAAGCLWGTIGLFVMLMNRQGAGPALTGFLRLGFAFLLMFVLTTARFGLRSFRTDRNTLGFSLLLGLISHGLNNWAYASSVTYNGVSLAVVLLNLAPMLTLLWAFAIFSETPTALRWLAVLLNLAGCLLAVTGGRLTGLSLTAAGLLFGIGAALTYSVNPILGRFATQKAHPYVVTTYCFLTASVFLAAIAKPWHAAIPWNPALLLTGFVYALATALSFILYYTGVQMIRESSRIPVIASVEIVVATAIGVLLFGEHIAPGQIAGILLIFVSILLMNARRSKNIRPGGRMH